MILKTVGNFSTGKNVPHKKIIGLMMSSGRLSQAVQLKNENALLINSKVLQFSRNTGRLVYGPFNNSFPEVNMALLKKQDQEKLKEKFANLDSDVSITCFTQEFECQYCEETRSMAEEVSALSGKIHLKTLDFVKDKAIADTYGVDKIPAIIVEGKKDFGIRFFGIPAGYEFMSLIESISSASTTDTDLHKDTLAKLSTINKPVHIQVMVTPT